MTSTQASEDRDDFLGHVVDDFFNAVERGEKPDVSDYMRRYPEVADLLKVAIPAMRAAEDAAARSDPMSPRDTNPSDKQLGGFRILRQLGRGGMGIVYEAEQISMKRRVALKVLPLAGLIDEVKIHRFHNEVRIVAALDHPNIVSVYMVGEERGVHYYAMQLVRGRSLAQVITSLRQARDEGEALSGESLNRITSRGAPARRPADQNDAESKPSSGGGSDPLTQTAHPDTIAGADDSTIPHATRREYFRSVAALGIQAAAALHHAHEQGIVHRDIKPANLLLDTSSQLFVTDFGLARMEADAGVTMTGDLVGTLRYMAPEQALGKRVMVDHRADIYSLAVTLYELLTLQPAYSGEDRQHLMKQIAFDEPTSPRRIDPEIPWELETIVQKGMSKDIEDRYSSAHGFAEDLRLFLDHRPIKAKPPSFPQIFTKWTRRNPAVVWASIVTLGLVTIASGIFTLLVLKQWDRAVQASEALREANQETEALLRTSTVTRLALQSRALQDERPSLGVLLAIEAVELSQPSDVSMLPIVHEALLNASQTLRKGRPLTGHGTPISALTFSSDWLVTLGDDKAHLWDLTARNPSRSSRVLGSGNERITSIAISEDGRWLLTGGSKLQRWDLTARHPELSPVTMPAGDGFIEALGLSSDGRRLVVQSDDGTVRLWDLTTANPATSTVLSRQSDPFRQFVLSPDGRWVAAATRWPQPYRVQLWDLDADDKSAFPQSLPGFEDDTYLRTIAMSPDSRWLVTGNRTTARLWDLKAETPATLSWVLPAANRGGVRQLVITDDSRWLFTTAGNSPLIRRWNLSAADPSSSPFDLRGHKDDVRVLAAIRDSRWLVSGGSDGTARIWDLNAVDPSSAARVLTAHDTQIDAVAMDPSGRWVATADLDGTARLWDLHAPDPSSPEFVLRGHEDDIYSTTAISADGRWIATEIRDNAVQLWDLKAKGPSTFSRVLQRPKTKIASMEISPDDRWLATGGRDGNVQLWDLTSEDIPSSLTTLGGRANAIARNATRREAAQRAKLTIGPNSRWLAIAGPDYGVELWDLKANNGVAPSRHLSGHGSPGSVNHDKRRRPLVDCGGRPQ